MIEAAVDDIILYDVVPHDDATSDLDPSIELSIMPNPSSTSARIENMYRSTPVRVYNISGAFVYEGLSTAGGELILDVSAFSNGIYNIETRDAKARRVVLRLEVQR